MPPLPVGTLRAELLERLLGKFASSSPRVGAGPLWFLATLLLPEGGASETRVESLFTELGEACAELEVALVGGHTEVTAGLPRPIVVGCMLGEVDKDRLVTTAGAREGDALLLTKGVPLEGAAILAREHGAEAAR